MKHVFRMSWLLLLLATASSVVRAEAPNSKVPSALSDYVRRPEPDFAWKLASESATDDGTVYHLELTSQKWQDIVWKHALMVYEPRQIDHPGHMLLFVTGGSIGRKPGRDDVQRGLQLARLCGARVAVIHQVPNQPLMGGRKEDDLITETWLKFLKTGDPTWPLLFPMVKSAVKAMDALEQFVESQGGQKPDGFVITGASKRGWTSWLTPVAEKRIVGTAPIVIDTLNFTKQMKYQMARWGKYSEQIVDYTSKGLVRPSGEPKTPREKQLWRMMDPFTYRKQLTLPKLLIVGTNDRYWTVDAMNNYWDDLVGGKHVLQVPNAGHGLDGGVEHALTTLAVFFRHCAAGRQLPAFSWKYGNGNKRMTLSLSAGVAPVEARLWTASSRTEDFRESRWESKPLEGSDKNYTGTIPVPGSGHAALFGELRFKFESLSYSLTTQVFRD